MADLDYAQVTTTVTVGSGGTLLVTGNPVTYDGVQAVMVTFCAPCVVPGTTNITIGLYEGASKILTLWFMAEHTLIAACFASVRFVPTVGSHTYNVKANTDAASGSAGGGVVYAANAPAYMRIVAA